jgi:hypothetical protein
MNKNFGGGGKKLTRKNRKYLMKLYRKNRTRKHRGGGKPGPAGTVCWDEIYWHQLDSICGIAISQLQNRYGIPEYDEEATNLKNLRVHNTNKHVNELNMNLVRRLKLLTKKIVNNGYEITLDDDDQKFLNQFCTDTPCCVISGGGRIDDRDGLIRFYKTTEDLEAANAKGLVQHYLRDVTWKNRYTGQEETEQFWMTEEDYDNLNSKLRLRQIELDANERTRTGKTMMNTLASDEDNQYWELYKAAEALVQDKTKEYPMFTGDFPLRLYGRVAFADEAEYDDGTVSLTKLEGGGKELPTFESTKTKLKQILEKVKPDNEYYEFSQKLNQELNKIEEKKFNEFVNKIYENFDKIMSIPIKQKGGMLSVRRSTRGDDGVCSICFDDLNPRFGPEASEIHKVVECSRRRGQHKFHEHCILSTRRNVCPLCRHEDTFLNNRGESIMINNAPVQINAMAMQLPFDQMTPEEQVEILNIRYQRRREQVLDGRLASVRHLIRELWGMFLFIFTCRSAGGVWFRQYDYNYTTFLAMFYGSVIAVELWPERRGSVSMTDQLAEFIVRIMTFLDDMPGGMANAGGGKKTRRKRYKRKRRTKRKMRKKRGGVKIGDRVEKKYKMDKLDEYGNPTGKKFWQDFKGLVQNIDNEGNTTIYWYADNSKDVLTKSQSKSLKIIPPKDVKIGDMHQADIPQARGVSYTGNEKVSHLPKEYLTPAVKPQGYDQGIQKKTNDGFVGTSDWAKEQLKKLQSMK